MVRPLGSKVLLLFPDTDNYRDSGGVLVRQDRDERLDAKVVAVGPDTPPDIRVGDTVLADPWSGLVCDFGGVKYRQVPAESILAVFDP